MSAAKKVKAASGPVEGAAPRHASGSLGGSDIAILAAMTIFAVAVGLGLNIQGGLSMLVAGAVASAVFAVSALIHGQRMRIHLLRAGQSDDDASFAAEEPDLASRPTLPGPRRDREREPSLGAPEAAPAPAPGHLDAASDRAAAQLAIAAAALRDGQAAASRRQAPAPAIAETDAEFDAAAAWAEVGTVDEMVRKYAEELDRGTPSEEAPAPAVAVQPSLRDRTPKPRMPVPPPAAAEPAHAAAIRRAAAGEVEIHLQPVVSLADRKARLYEVFAKIADGRGGVLSAADYAGPAAELGLTLAVEHATIMRCCNIQRTLSERGRARAMILRLSNAALRDRSFLQRLLTDIRPDPLLTDLIIFEVDQADIEQGGADERENMELIARAGFRFALGNAETLALEVEELAVRRIGFVRIAAAQLAAEAHAGAVGDLRQGAIETIVTNVTLDDQARLAAEFGLVLAQGGLFSEAKPLRADVVKAGAATRAA